MARPVAAMTLPSAFVLLLLVIDPFGNLPFFVAALQGVAPERRRLVLTRELLVAYAVMVGFLFAGGPLLGVLGISEPALGIADQSARMWGAMIVPDDAKAFVVNWLDERYGVSLN